MRKSEEREVVVRSSRESVLRGGDVKEVEEGW